MKERPILFSAPMVRAILEGRKTQTRRVVKLPERSSLRGTWEPTTIGGEDGNNIIHDDQVAIWHTGTGDVICCPYGIPGDRLWVRETWNRFEAWQGFHYAADYEGYGIGPDDDPDHVPDHAVRWKPSIHMPRFASRILLEVVSVRVERLQDISRGGAMAEGCPFPNMAHGDDPRDWYRRLWDEINGPESWNANPWVWVIEFRRITP